MHSTMALRVAHIVVLALVVLAQSSLAVPLTSSSLEDVWSRVHAASALSSPADWVDQLLNVTQLVNSRGYGCEDHRVVTSDGYILAIQRLPVRAGVAKKGVVFLQHGILDSSMTWVIGSLDTKLRLPFILVDAGFEVWLGNGRGNTYSRAHVSLDPSDPAFWQYSFDDYASKDLPAAFAHVLQVSGESQLHYVGHSEGTLIGFIAFSTYPEIARLVKTFVALAPVAYISKTSFAPLLNFLPKNIVFDILGNKSVLSFPMGPVGDVIPVTCDVIPALCETILCMIAGCESKTSTDPSRMGPILAHYPAGTSAMDVDHFYQLSRFGALQAYDFGTSEANYAHYGRPTPPLYDVTQLMVPSALFSGTKDTLADPKDVAALVALLPPDLVLRHDVLDGYGHGDFLWATDAAARLYSSVLAVIGR
eukprot:Opistho-1_new@51877